jgi:threonine aldolase
MAGLDIGVKMGRMIDLRSDTVTRPSPGMREAMARAEVGDDVYGEDPTVRLLEETVAGLLGKETGLFVPSGTMSNQLAIMTSTRRGDEVVCGEGAHIYWFECGAGAALSGVQFAIAGRGGLFDVADMEAAIRPSGYMLPRTSLVAVENTHNRAGGRIFPEEDVLSIARRARELGAMLHLDGARLWNTAAATGASLARLAAPFDSVSVCFSKGLGAPIGSALAGSRAQLQEAHRMRKMLGGGMRQAGIIAAGALFAMAHHRDRLVEDHENARLFAAEVRSRFEASDVTVVDPETNIVNIDIPAKAVDPVMKRAQESGVLIGPIMPTRLRAVFHLDVTREQGLVAAKTVASSLQAVCGR